jgi:hypothetical protein
MKTMVAILALTILMPTLAQAQSCRELRRACEMKEELGETGQGNCRRYREMCGGGGGIRESCRDLRWRCLHKEELGETGQGNCRAYREQCQQRF